MDFMIIITYIKISNFWKNYLLHKFQIQKKKHIFFQTIKIFEQLKKKTEFL